MPRPMRNVKGQRFGLLKVLRRVGTHKTRSRTSPLWQCVCDCGTKIRRTTDNLQENSDCGCRSKQRAQTVGWANKGKGKPGTAKRSTLTAYKHNAKKRRLEWSLSDDEFYNLVENLCFYTGYPPSNTYKTRLETFIYNGIDRIDNAKGYTKENCTTCSYVVNKMRQDLPREVFLKTIKDIYEHLHLETLDFQKDI